MAAGGTSRGDFADVTIEKKREVVRFLSVARVLNGGRRGERVTKT